MPTLEWIGEHENLPHQFSSTAAETLQLAKMRDIFQGQDLGNKWGVLSADKTSRTVPYPPLERDPATGQWGYIPLNRWTIENVKIGGQTIREIFDPAYVPPPPPPGVATPWVGGPNDPQIYVPPVVPIVPPVVPIITGGGEPVPATVEWWIDLIDRVDAASAAGTLTAAGLQAAVSQLSTVPQPRPALVSSKVSDWSFILANHLLDHPAGFAPVRVVVEGRGRMVYTQEELNQALTAGGYIEHLDAPPAGSPAGVPATASSSPSLLTWGVIAAAALFALRGKKGG